MNPAVIEALRLPTDAKDQDAKERSGPEQRAPCLRRADDEQEYAESKDVPQGFVFHKAPHAAAFVRILFYIPFLFFWQVNDSGKIVGVPGSRRLRRLRRFAAAKPAQRISRFRRGAPSIC